MGIITSAECMEVELQINTSPQIVLTCFNLETEKGSVMADRGFLINGMLSDMGVKLHMPSFKGAERPQLSTSEGQKSEHISSVRIHIERAIQRIKTYHILDGELKLSMKDIAEQVFTVCGYLVNFQSPIVKC